jgi:hypothetical protein
MKIENTFDRIVGIVGLLLSIPVLLEFLNKRTVNALLLIILILLIVAFLLYRKAQANLPLYTYLEVNKVLKFHDAAAHSATVNVTYRARANHTGLQQLWLQKISADGRVGNFMVDGQPASLKRSIAGSLDIGKEFERVLKKNEERTVSFSYDLTDSFPAKREGHTHIATTKTRKFHRRIEFHTARIGREPRCFVDAGGGLEHDLDPPRILNSGSVFEDEVLNPKVGAYYTVQWVWD